MPSPGPSMLEQTSRRPHGRVYTPDTLADRLWDLAERYGQWRANGSLALTVLDPAAGEGALLRAVERRRPSARVVGIELDTVAAQVARERGLDIYVADTLSVLQATSQQARTEQPSRPLAEIAETLPIMPMLRRAEIDVIIANPPYLRETGHRDVFRALRTRYGDTIRSLYRKDADLHHFFWLAATQWLRPGGLAVYLTPAYWLEAESAEPLRQLLLQEGVVCALTRAHGSGWFPDASVEAAITVWRKHPAGPVDDDQRLGINAKGADILDDSNRTTHRVVLPPEGPWWISSDDVTDFDNITQSMGDLYTVIEGVSTGANRVRKKDALVHPGLVAGAGIFVLTPSEADALRNDPAADRLIVPRHRADATAADQFVLRVRDGEFPHLDEHATQTRAVSGEQQQLPSSVPGPIARHLLRFRPVLEARAEMRRNPTRSWYANAWPRPELDLSDDPNAGQIEGALVTPKWSKRGNFRPLTAAVPMTDHRILVPKSAQVAAAADAIMAWLNGPDAHRWYAARLKHKGPLIEFYGASLLRVPIRY